MKGDVVINGVRPTRGMYLVHRGRVKTQGRVVRVTSKGVVVWWSCDTGAEVRGDSEKLRANGYEWDEHPLIDYAPTHEFPYVEGYPEMEPYDVPQEKKAHALDAAYAHAKRGDPKRATAIYNRLGHSEAAEVANKMMSRWK